MPGDLGSEPHGLIRDRGSQGYLRSALAIVGAAAKRTDWQLHIVAKEISQIVRIYMHGVRVRYRLPEHDAMGLSKHPAEQKPALTEFQRQFKSERLTLRYARKVKSRSSRAVRNGRSSPAGATGAYPVSR
jgi:hypothetical protein